MSLFQQPFGAENILRRLEWTVIRRLDGLLHGDYQTLFRGFGLDLADLREYQYHDDVRYIDWNVTARLMTPYIRVYNEDREVTAWFLLDLSPSVDFGSQVKKRSVSTEFITLLARLLTRHGNRVGVPVLWRQRRYRDSGAERSASRAAHPPPDPFPAAAFPFSGDEPAAIFCRPLFGLYESDPSFSSCRILLARPAGPSRWPILAQRHEIVAVRLYDPLEMELPDLGLLMMRDAETGEQLFVDTHDRAFQEAIRSCGGAA